jgi:hypothetical protein
MKDNEVLFHADYNFMIFDYIIFWMVFFGENRVSDIYSTGTHTLRPRLGEDLLPDFFITTVFEPLFPRPLYL